MLRQTSVAPFVVGATDARPLGARSGLRPGITGASAAVNSTSWYVGPIAGIIDAEAANEAGPYAFAIDAASGGAVNAADSTNPRLDGLYVQMSDPAEGDGSSVPSVKVLYAAGTAAASPTLPTTPARSFLIVQLNIPKSGGGTPSYTWVAPYLAAAGGALGFATEAALNANTNVPFGTEATVYSTGARYVMGQSSTWARRGLNSLSTGLSNTGGGVVSAGATSNAIGSYTVTMPVRGTVHIHGQAYVYANTTNAMAGAFFAQVDGTNYNGDGKSGRIHSHGRVGFGWVNMDADFDLPAGNHSLGLYVASDPNTAGIELWDTTWNYSVTY
jgi:hypothetical protein